MKKLIFAVMVVMIIGSVAFAGDVYVRGHYRDTDGDGYKETYVQPYHRTSPNNSLNDNYSTQGNYNPYTGATGQINPYNNNSNTGATGQINPYNNSRDWR